MTDDETQFEFTEIKTLRGTEAKTIADKQNAGWELVSRDTGRLRTTLSFRRPKPKTPWRLYAGLAAVFVVLMAIAGVGALLESDDDPTTEAAAPTSTSQAPPFTPSEPAPETVPVAPEAPPAPEINEVLTIENNEALANLLHTGDYCDQSVADFAAEYRGRTIQFDGHIAAMNNHGDDTTRYDILLDARDFDESDGRGPAFQYQDVNMSDLKLTGPYVPDTIGVLDRFRFTAVVEEYEPVRGCLFQLDPVSTEIR